MGCQGEQKGHKMVKNEKNYVCCAPFLSNHTSYDCHLWYSSKNWSYIQVFNFDFSGCQQVKRAKNDPTQQKIACHAPYLKNYRSYDFIYGVAVSNDGVSRPFLYFQNFDFLGCQVGVNGQKMVQNEKSICHSHSIFQEPYIVWLSFVVHKCKMRIFPGVFFFFTFSKF